MQVNLDGEKQLEKTPVEDLGWPVIANILVILIFLHLALITRFPNMSHGVHTKIQWPLMSSLLFGPLQNFTHFLQLV